MFVPDFNNLSIMLKAVIFDMDGVLIDSEPIHFSAVVQVLNNLGINIEENYLNRFIGDTNENMWQLVISEFNIENAPEKYISEQVKSTIDCMMNGNYSTIEGVIDLLEELKYNDIIIGLASSSPPNVIEAFIEKLNISGYFSKWISGNEVISSKPAPYIYQEIVNRLGLLPENCVAIEDSVFGVTSAKSAGLKCIGYCNPNGHYQNLAKADWIVNQMTEIKLQYIQRLF